MNSYVTNLTNAMFANAMKNTDQVPSILIVDDDEDSRLLLRWAFHDVMPNLIVRGVGNGQEALTYLRSGHQPPFLVITDMHMPLIGGDELTSRLRQMPALETLPIVVLSSLTSEADRIRCYQSGADAYLPKPRLLPDLLDLARLLIRNWLAVEKWPAVAVSRLSVTEQYHASTT